MFKIYSKPACAACNKAKATLKDAEYLIMGKDYDMDKFMSFGVPHRTFPLITQVVDGVEVYVGTLEDALKLIK